MLMSVKIYFDMDGTVFDLYGKQNWLEMLRNEVEGAFIGDWIPEINKTRFKGAVDILLENGVQFGVITWLPMQASPEYEQICTAEKRRWVAENLPFVTEFNCVSYGIPKQDCIQKRAQKIFLIDDNEEICKTWETAKQRKAVHVTSEYTADKALRQIAIDLGFIKIPRNGEL